MLSDNLVDGEARSNYLQLYLHSFFFFLNLDCMFPGGGVAERR